MPILTDPQKAFIVRELAMYSTPTEAAEALKAEFGVVIERGHVCAYNPLGSTGKQVAKKWVDLFNATRKAFLKDVSAIPIAQRSYRLRQLNDMAALAKRNKNLPLAAQLMEQAAKEVGDSFSNRQTINHKGLAKPETPPSREAIEARIAALIGKGTGDAKPK